MLYPFDRISDFIFFEHAPKKADVILVAGSSYRQLMDKAVLLYKQGYASYILPSGGTNSKLPPGQTEWEFLQQIAVSQGIPQEAILKEDQAQHTFDNARLSWQVLEKQGFSVKTVILVTKTYHARRALLTYQTVFPASVEFVVCPVVDERDIQRENWFLSQDKTEKVMKEVEKIGLYFGKHIPKWAK